MLLKRNLDDNNFVFPHYIMSGGLSVGRRFGRRARMITINDVKRIRMGRRTGRRMAFSSDLQMISFVQLMRCVSRLLNIHIQFTISKYFGVISLMCAECEKKLVTRNGRERRPADRE